MNLERLGRGQTPDSEKKERTSPNEDRFQEELKVKKLDNVDPDEPKKKRQREEMGEETKQQLFFEKPQIKVAGLSVFELESNKKGSQDIFGRTETTANTKNARTYGSPQKTSIPSPMLTSPDDSENLPQSQNFWQSSSAQAPPPAPQTYSQPQPQAQPQPLPQQQTTPLPRNTPRDQPIEQPREMPLDKQQSNQKTTQDQQSDQTQQQTKQKQTTVPDEQTLESPESKDKSKDSSTGKKDQELFAPEKTAPSELTKAEKESKDEIAGAPIPGQVEKKTVASTSADITEDEDEDEKPKSSGFGSIQEEEEEKKDITLPEREKLKKGRITSMPFSEEDAGYGKKESQKDSSKFANLHELAKSFSPIISLDDTPTKSMEKEAGKEKKDSSSTTPISPPGTTISMTPTIAAQATTLSTQVSSYIDPQIQNLFAQMVGTIIVMSEKGITKTEVLLNSPAFKGSLFENATVTFEKYATAPDSFNIYLRGTPQAVEVFNANLDGLIQAFDKGQFNFRIGRLETSYEEGRPLFKRKSSVSDKGGGMKDDTSREQQ